MRGSFFGGADERLRDAGGSSIGGAARGEGGVDGLPDRGESAAKSVGAGVVCAIVSDGLRHAQRGVAAVTLEAICVVYDVMADCGVVVPRRRIPQPTVAEMLKRKHSIDEFSKDLVACKCGWHFREQHARDFGAAALKDRLLDKYNEHRAHVQQAGGAIGE